MEWTKTVEGLIGDTPESLISGEILIRYKYIYIWFRKKYF